MIHWWHVVIGIPVIIGVIAGIIQDIEHGNLGPKLNDWPRRKHHLPRDSHAQVRQDNAFVDGMITMAALDEIEDIFN